MFGRRRGVLSVLLLIYILCPWCFFFNVLAFEADLTYLFCQALCRLYFPLFQMLLKFFAQKIKNFLCQHMTYYILRKEIVNKKSKCWFTHQNECVSVSALLYSNYWGKDKFIVFFVFSCVGGCLFVQGFWDHDVREFGKHFYKLCPGWKYPRTSGLQPTQSSPFTLFVWIIKQILSTVLAPTTHTEEPMKMTTFAFPS